MVPELDSLVPWKTKLPVTVTVNVPEAVVDIVSWECATVTQSHTTVVGVRVAVTDGLEVAAERDTSFAHPLRAVTLTGMVREEPIATDNGVEAEGTMKLGSAELETVP
jgi:hypothetical protein